MIAINPLPASIIGLPTTNRNHQVTPGSASTLR